MPYKRGMVHCKVVKRTQSKTWGNNEKLKEMQWHLDERKVGAVSCREFHIITHMWDGL